MGGAALDPLGAVEHRRTRLRPARTLFPAKASGIWACVAQGRFRLCWCSPSAYNSRELPLLARPGEAPTESHPEIGFVLVQHATFGPTQRPPCSDACSAAITVHSDSA